MKGIIFVVGFILFLSFSSLLANINFSLNFAHSKSQRTVDLKVVQDEEYGGFGYLYYQGDNSHKIKVGGVQVLKSSQAPYVFRATSKILGVTNIGFTLAIGGDASKSTIFQLVNHLYELPNGVNCIAGPCQDYIISAGRDEITIK